MSTSFDLCDLEQILHGIDSLCVGQLLTRSDSRAYRDCKKEWVSGSCNALQDSLTMLTRL